jgi:hypothetical protein
VKVEKPAEVQPVEAAVVEKEPVDVAEPTEIPTERVQPSKVRRCAECFTLACTQHDAVTGAECFIHPRRVRPPLHQQCIAVGRRNTLGRSASFVPRGLWRRQ